MRRRRRQIGFRREVAFVLLLALFVVVAVSAFTLFSYRNAIELLIEERREEALQLVRGVAKILSTGEVGTPEALARLATGARAITLLDSRGQIRLSSTGEEAPALPAGLDLGGLHEPRVFGPGDNPAAGIVALAPLRLRGQRLLLMLELPAERLVAQRRGTRMLAAVVLAVDVAIVALLIFFLDRILGPYEALLRAAHETDGPPVSDEDEMSFLLSTFERAMAAMREPDPEDFEEEIDALQRTLARSLESGVLVLDTQHRLLAINEIGRALLGVEEVPELTDFRQALRRQPGMVEALEAAVAGNRSIQRQEVSLDDEGHDRVLGLSVHSLRRDDGEVRGYLGLFADLTEVRRQAEDRRIAHSLSQLAEVTAGIAHELRNSLATLQGYLTLIERRPDEEAITDYLAEIRGECDHLQRVLEDFLSFARPGTLRLQQVDLGAVARQVAADPHFAEAVLVEDGIGAEVRVHADPDLVARALRNLVHNAVLAHSTASVSNPVKVRLARAVDGVRMTIEDQGPGLPAEVRQRLFQPFVTGRPGGVGMGLAVAHRIVDLHGGSLRIEERAGGGVSAEIHFPI